MKKKILLLLLATPLLLQAQDYTKAIGFRGGESWGFTVSLFSDEKNAAEALLSFRNGGMQLTAMKETFMPVLLNYSTHIFFYKGYGGHLGFVRTNREGKDTYSSDYHRRRSFPLAGIDGVLGLEYRLYKYPLTAGFDFKPFAELGGSRIFRLDLWDFGFIIRYTFNK
jgi:hypothetical protein